MRRIYYWSLWLLLLAAPGLNAAEAVKALLFVGPNCGDCADLSQLYLPGLAERHGDALEMAVLDQGSEPGGALYQEAAEKLALGAWHGEPVALVGEKALVGLMSIAAELGDNLQGLAKDPNSQRWPQLAGLPQALPAARAALGERLASSSLPQLPSNGDAQEQEYRNAMANVLAIAVLAAMVLLLGHSLWRVRRGGAMGVERPAVMTLLLLAGLGISAYTAYTSLAHVSPMCGPMGDCAAVQGSEYAKLFGIPMGVLGLIGYGAIGITWLAARWRSPLGGGWRWLPWGIALGGVLFSLRLTYLEPFVIGATCMWCLGSAVIITLLLWQLSGHTVAVRSRG